MHTKLPITERYPKALHPNGDVATDSPSWVQSIDNPYLHGLFAPVTTEHSFDDLQVTFGAIPEQLAGAYFRNGPNQIHKPNDRYHWFDGDGMVHGIWFEGGKARYKNAFVQTKGRKLEAEKGESIYNGVLGPFDFSLPGGPLKDTGNTDLIYWQDKLLALWYESGHPKVLEAENLTPSKEQSATLQQLSSVGRISAHSKVDPHTGDLCWFSYGLKAPYMKAGIIKADGTTISSPVPLPGPRRPHDIGITDNFLILHDFPIFHDEAVFKKTGKRIPVFHPDVPTRFAILPRAGGEPRWFEAEPCYMLHVIGAWEEDNKVIMVGCRQPHFNLSPNKENGKLAMMLAALTLHASVYQWTFDLDTGLTSEKALDDSFTEFPTMHPMTTSKKVRYTYLQEIPVEVPVTFEALVKLDISTGEKQRFAYGKGLYGSESPFVPRPGATAEDDGWVVSFITDTNDWSSACWIFDGQDITKGPICKINIPARIPAGFHATFVPKADDQA